MNIFQKIYGSFLGLIGKFLAVFLGLIMAVTEKTAIFLGNITMSVLSVAGGCLLVFFLIPVLWVFILSPTTLVIILVFVVFPLLSKLLVSKIDYLKYITTEYLFDKSSYYVNGVYPRFESFQGYKDQYRKMENERIRQEQERQRAEQEKIWEERFRQYTEYANTQWNQGQGGFAGSGSYVDPSSSFKDEYERNCDVLGVGYRANKEEIKIAYRKMAKVYHPDLNKDANAEDMFKKVNSAYEFLSDGNIERYKSMFS